MAISEKGRIQLVRLGQDGVPVDGRRVPDELAEACQSGAQWFGSVGYVPPWVGYLAFDGTTCVGCCAFKTSPKNGAAEISYMTLEQFRGQGYATQMVRSLVELARETGVKATVTAQTMPGRNASTRVLTKAGFIWTGEIVHPEDGVVAEWRLLA